MSRDKRKVSKCLSCGKTSRHSVLCDNCLKKLGTECVVCGNAVSGPLPLCDSHSGQDIRKVGTWRGSLMAKRLKAVVLTPQQEELLADFLDRRFGVELMVLDRLLPGEEGEKWKDAYVRVCFGLLNGKAMRIAPLRELVEDLLDSAWDTSLDVRIRMKSCERLRRLILPDLKGKVGLFPDPALLREYEDTYKAAKPALLKIKNPAVRGMRLRELFPELLTVSRKKLQNICAMKTREATETILAYRLSERTGGSVSALTIRKQLRFIRKQKPFLEKLGVAP